MGSPSIAIRSGWMAIGILPFLMYALLWVLLRRYSRLIALRFRVFATKVNPIGILTGVSHEKLQVYHRWTAWIMCEYTSERAFALACRSVLRMKADVLALIHTLPFLVRSYKDGTLRPIWERTPWYWTGVAALVPQVRLPFRMAASSLYFGDRPGWSSCRWDPSGMSPPRLYDMTLYW